MNAYQRFSRRLNLLERLTFFTYVDLFALWLAVNVAFAGFYFLLSTFWPAHGPILLSDMPLGERAFNSLYFSIITGTSTGYGDIVPVGFSKVLAMLQTILALLVFAVFVTKLVSRRQEVALREVHRMTFEEIFYNIRQGLFIIRKDFDVLIRSADQQGSLTERDWETLTTAYLQAQSLIEEIPNLYEGQSHDLSMIDPKRERLLFEAIHRTLQRIDQLLQICQQRSIDWLENKDSAQELHTLMEIIDRIMPLWRERSPYHRIEEFDDIFNVGQQLHERIKSALRHELAGAVTAY